MKRFGGYLSALILLSLVLVSTFGGPSLCKAKSMDYYFASDSSDYLQPDNRITISIDNGGYATVSVRLHAKAYYPTGVGYTIDIPIPYPMDRVEIKDVSISNLARPTYKVVGLENQTTIQVNTEGSSRDVYVEAIYIVEGILSGNEIKIRLLMSSFTTEVSINIMMDSRETWINRKSVNLNPRPSKDTYFLINEEVIPIAIYLVLSNVNSKIIECSLEIEDAPYGLDMTPYYALVVSVIPVAFSMLIARIIKIISWRKRVSIIVLAYRNLHRRIGRFVLTILGVGIPCLLLVQMLIQNALAQKMLGPEKASMEWYLALILMISIIIGGFQVFNTVFSSVLERIRELGLMKAIGFNPSYIIRMVIAESSLIGIIAGLFGSLVAATMATVSAQVFYGLSIPNTEYAWIIANSYGGTSLDNPFLRNYIIALLSWLVIIGILMYLWPREYDIYSSLFMIISFLLFLLLIRPTDPFTVDRLIEIAPDLTMSMVGGVLFATTLSTLAGSYVAYTAGKIEPSEAMRHV